MTRRADADRLAAFLDSAAGDDVERGAVATADADEQAMLLLASALREAAPPVEPMRAEFRAALREQVVQAARDAKAEPALLTRLRDRVHQMRYSTGVVTGSGIAAMALSGGGVAAAAEGAQPGEVLYPVKIGLEDLRLALTAGDVAAGQRAVSYAFDRMAEAAAAVDADDDAAAATALEGAADRMRQGTGDIVDAGLLEPLLRLSDDVADQQATLDRLRPLLGPEALAAAAGLDEVLSDARDAIADAVVPGSIPGSPLHDLPGLPVPTQSSTTPSPTATTPPLDATPVPTPGGAPSTSDDGEVLPVPVPVPLPDLPDVQVPEVQAPEVEVPHVQVPGARAPGVQAPAPQPVPPPPAPTAGDTTVGGVVDHTVDAVGDAVEEAVDAVASPVAPVAPLAPSPVATVLDSTTQSTGGVVDDVGAGLGDTLATVEDSAGDAREGVGDVTSGILGGG